MSLARPDYRQLRTLTDDSGVIRQSLFSIPLPSSNYATGDAARALVVAVLDDTLYPDSAASSPLPIRTYLQLIVHSWDTEKLRFRCMLRYDRSEWIATQPDLTHGRVLWALGLTVRHSTHTDIRDAARALFLRGLQAAGKLTCLRGVALATLGIHHFLAAEPDHVVCKRLRELLATTLFNAYKRQANDPERWSWFEDRLATDNAPLAHALLASGVDMGRADMRSAGEAALSWLVRVQTRMQNGIEHLSIVGSDGWLRDGAACPRYDQLPSEACQLVSALLYASTVTSSVHSTVTGSATTPAPHPPPSSSDQYRTNAQMTLAWFHGRNDGHIALVSPSTGACQDALQSASTLNPNHSASAVISYLLASLALSFHANHYFFN